MPPCASGGRLEPSFRRHDPTNWQSLGATGLGDGAPSYHLTNLPGPTAPIASRMARTRQSRGRSRPSGARSSRYYYSGKHSRGRRLPLALIALLFLLAAAAALFYSMRSDAAAGAGFWHASGTEILDENGQHVRIAGVTWYGMESSYLVPAGLDYQP